VLKRTTIYFYKLKVITPKIENCTKESYGLLFMNSRK